MFECKDRGIGQNDLYVAAVKAETVRADVVVMVSTHHLHANVQEKLTGLNGGHAGNNDKFTAIISESASQIKSDLTAFLSNLTSVELNNWLEHRGKQRLNTRYVLDSWDNADW
jgi:hypothetical protein